MPRPSPDDQVGALPRATLELRLLETVAHYMLVNVGQIPLIVLALAAVLARWQPLSALVPWAAFTVTCWLALHFTFRAFMADEARAKHYRQWLISASTLVCIASFSLCAPVLMFWVRDSNANNVLLYVFSAASLATASSQSAPSRIFAAANLIPYALVFVVTNLVYEPYPMKLGLLALQALYLIIIVSHAATAHKLAKDSVILQEEKRALIDRLRDALATATTAQERAEEASRAKSQFLANMSHELRTPLNAILGFSEVIRDRIFGDQCIARYSDYAGSIHASGTHLLGLINDVLDLSKIEAGKLELHIENIDLVAEASEALRFVEPQAARKNVSLVREMPSFLEIAADKRAVRQVMVNLLSNAVKFTPPGGTVSVLAGDDPTGSISLSVRDTGIGIGAEDLLRVLESFSQVRHDILPTAELGTGLGLAIAKSLAEAHGGKITITSELGEGTIVTIHLPKRGGCAVKAA